MAPDSAAHGYEVLLISADADGVSPSVLLSPCNQIGPQYLFNVPDGFSRLVLEHRIRPSAHLSAVFVTSLQNRSIGGMSGLLFRLCKDGHGCFNLYGPPGTLSYMHALRNIISWKHPKVSVNEMPMNGPSITHEDEHAIIFSLGANSNSVPCFKCRFTCSSTYKENEKSCDISTPTILKPTKPSKPLSESYSESFSSDSNSDFKNPKQVSKNECDPTPLEKKSILNNDGNDCYDGIDANGDNGDNDNIDDHDDNQSESSNHSFYSITCLSDSHSFDDAENADDTHNADDADGAQNADDVENLDDFIKFDDTETKEHVNFFHKSSFRYFNDHSIGNLMNKDAEGAGDGVEINFCGTLDDNEADIGDGNLNDGLKETDVHVENNKDKRKKFEVKKVIEKSLMNKIENGKEICKNGGINNMKETNRIEADVKENDCDIKGKENEMEEGGRGCIDDGFTENLKDSNIKRVLSGKGSEEGNSNGNEDSSDSGEEIIEEAKSTKVDKREVMKKIVDRKIIKEKRKKKKINNGEESTSEEESDSEDDSKSKVNSSSDEESGSDDNSKIKVSSSSEEESGSDDNSKSKVSSSSEEEESKRKETSSSEEESGSDDNSKIKVSSSSEKEEESKRKETSSSEEESCSEDDSKSKVSSSSEKEEESKRKETSSSEEESCSEDDSKSKVSSSSEEEEEIESKETSSSRDESKSKGINGDDEKDCEDGSSSKEESSSEEKSSRKNSRTKVRKGTKEKSADCEGSREEDEYDISIKEKRRRKESRSVDEVKKVEKGVKGVPSSNKTSEKKKNCIGRKKQSRTSKEGSSSYDDNDDNDDSDVSQKKKDTFNKKSDEYHHDQLNNKIKKKKSEEKNDPIQEDCIILDDSDIEIPFKSFSFRKKIVTTKNVHVYFDQEKEGSGLLRNTNSNRKRRASNEIYECALMNFDPLPNKRGKSTDVELTSMVFHEMKKNDVIVLSSSSDDSDDVMIVNDNAEKMVSERTVKETGGKRKEKRRGKRQGKEERKEQNESNKFKSFFSENKRQIDESNKEKGKSFRSDTPLLSESKEVKVGLRMRKVRERRKRNSKKNIIKNENVIKTKRNKNKTHHSDTVPEIKSSIYSSSLSPHLSHLSFPNYPLSVSSSFNDSLSNPSLPLLPHLNPNLSFAHFPLYQFPLPNFPSNFHHQSYYPPTPLHNPILKHNHPFSSHPSHYHLPPLPFPHLIDPLSIGSTTSPPFLTATATATTTTAFASSSTYASASASTPSLASFAAASCIPPSNPKSESSLVYSCCECGAMSDTVCIVQSSHKSQPISQHQNKHVENHQLKYHVNPLYYLDRFGNQIAAEIFLNARNEQNLSKKNQSNHVDNKNDTNNSHTNHPNLNHSNKEYPYHESYTKTNQLSNYASTYSATNNHLLQQKTLISSSSSIHNHHLYFHQNMDEFHPNSGRLNPPYPHPHPHPHPQPHLSQTSLHPSHSNQSFHPQPQPQPHLSQTPIHPHPSHSNQSFRPHLQPQPQPHLSQTPLHPPPSHSNESFHPSMFQIPSLITKDQIQGRNVLSQNDPTTCDSYKGILAHVCYFKKLKSSILIIDCPSPIHINELIRLLFSSGVILNNEKEVQFQEHHGLNAHKSSSCRGSVRINNSSSTPSPSDAGKKSKDDKKDYLNLSLVLHFSPSNVSKDKRYVDMMSYFGHDVRHLLMYNINKTELGFQKSLEVIGKLNAIDDMIFPLPPECIMSSVSNTHHPSSAHNLSSALSGKLLMKIKLDRSVSETITTIDTSSCIDSAILSTYSKQAHQILCAQPHEFVQKLLSLHAIQKEKENGRIDLEDFFAREFESMSGVDGLTWLKKFASVKFDCDLMMPSKLELESQHDSVITKSNPNAVQKSSNFATTESIKPTGSKNRKKNKRKSAENAAEKTVAEPAAVENAVKKGEKHENFVVNFLGTGAAEPSKLRGASCIVIEFPNLSSSMMLDAGEGALGQFKRRFGTQSYEKKLSQLQFLWISHKHADHSIGSLSILTSRPVHSPPLHVIAPHTVLRFLEEAQNAFKESGEFIPFFYKFHCSDFKEATFEKETGSNKSKKDARNGKIGKNENRFCTLFEIFQLDYIRTVSVHHCHDSWGILIKSKIGWSIAYSGDTKPCDAFVKMVHGCTLLIHEATFTSDLNQRAMMRMHSTVDDAISSALKAKAARVVLTHFSSTHSSFVKIDDAVSKRAMIAYDGMVIPSSCLFYLPTLMPIISSLFS